MNTFENRIAGVPDKLPLTKRGTLYTINHGTLLTNKGDSTYKRSNYG